MSCDLLPYTISESPQDLPLLVIPHVLLISIDSYVYISLPLSPTPYLYDWEWPHASLTSLIPVL